MHSGGCVRVNAPQLGSRSLILGHARRLAERSLARQLVEDLEMIGRRRYRCMGLVFAAAVCAVVGETAGAQRPTLLTLSNGGTVEVLGLRRWTLAMLQDSLAKYAPGDSLQSHACAAVLRYKLGFADAASTTFILREGEPSRVVVSVREPQDSARVRYRVMPFDTVNARAAWRLVTDAIARHPAAFWPAEREYLAPRLHVNAARFESPKDSIAGTAIITYLRARTADRDRREALNVLAHAPNIFDRATAALILANFGARDDTWRALSEALRESDGIVKGVAADVLQSLSERSPHSVRWGAAARGIHAMLDGTSLFELSQLIAVLTRTGVGPADARPFLRGGGEMLLAYLGSANPMLSGTSHRLLVQLRGTDLGTDVGPWRAWIEAL